ncbi:MAG TPA: hypothetical protein VGA92_01570, partial [Candidatus Nitrosotenuis sp.]
MNAAIKLVIIISSVLLASGIATEDAFAKTAKGTANQPFNEEQVCGDRLCGPDEKLSIKEKIGYYLLSFLEFDESTVIPQSRFQISGVTQQGTGILTTGNVMIKDFSTSTIIDRGKVNSLAVPTTQVGSKQTSTMKIDSANLAGNIRISNIDRDRFVALVDRTNVLNVNVFPDTTTLKIIKDGTPMKVKQANLVCPSATMWNGYKCVSVKLLQLSCDSLPKEKKLLCYQLVEKRATETFTLSKTYKLDSSKQQALSTRVYSDTTNLVKSISNYNSNVKVLCKANDFGTIRCADMLSLLSFYDQTIGKSIMEDIDAIYESTELNRFDEMLIDCGSGTWATHDIEDTKTQPNNWESGAYEDMVTEEDGEEISDKCSSANSGGKSSETSTSSGFSGMTGIDTMGGMCGSEFNFYTKDDMANKFVEMVGDYRQQCGQWIGSGVAAGDGGSDSATPTPPPPPPPPP